MTTPKLCPGCDDELQETEEGLKCFNVECQNLFPFGRKQLNVSKEATPTRPDIAFEFVGTDCLIVNGERYHIHPVAKEFFEQLATYARQLESDKKELEEVLQAYAKDPHLFSKRPCITCERISKKLGKDWGCVELRNGA